MLILKTFQDSLHYCSAEEFRFILNAVTVTIDTQCPHFPVVKHQGEPVGNMADVTRLELFSRSCLFGIYYYREAFTICHEDKLGVG